MAHTDTVAEIQNTFRVGTETRLGKVEIKQDFRSLSSFGSLKDKLVQNAIYYPATAAIW
jgi:hypothetical protein